MSWHTLRDGTRKYYKEDPETKKARMKRRLDQGAKFASVNGKRWTSDEVELFLRLTDTETDLTLCEQLKKSLGSIMYMRRKLSILRKGGFVPTVETMTMSEKSLHNHIAQGILTNAKK